MVRPVVGKHRLLIDRLVHKTAIVCIVIGLVTLIADLRFPDETAGVFGIDILQSYEDYFAGKYLPAAHQWWAPPRIHSGCPKVLDSKTIFFYSSLI